MLAACVILDKFGLFVQFWESAMAKAEYRSSLRSKKLINEALADLLQEKPFEKITVTDVVNRANINRGTFYAHYADIPDVVDHLIQQTFSSIREAFAEQEKPSEDIGHTLLAKIQSILEADLLFYQKILNSSVSTLLHDQLVETVSTYMLQNQDIFYSGSREEYVLAIRFCAGGLSNLYQDWFAGKLPYTLSELTAVAEALIHRMIRPWEEKNP